MHIVKSAIFLILTFPVLSFSQAKIDTVSFDEITVSLGDEAPDFSAEDEKGKYRKLSDLKGKKNLVLIFFRGYW